MLMKCIAKDCENDAEGLSNYCKEHQPKTEDEILRFIIPPKKEDDDGKNDDESNS